GDLAWWSRVYDWNFSSNIAGFVSSLQGKKLGSYVFNGSEKLTINPGPTGVNEVVTITQLPAVATAGYYRFTWHTEEETQSTDWIGYDETISNMKAAVKGLENFAGSITFSGTLTGGTSLTATFSGVYGGTSLATKGRYLTIEAAEHAA